MIKVHFFGMPIKTLGSLGKIRVGRVTGNTHIFFFGLGELIVYTGVRRPSTFSNDISSEAVRPILSIASIGRGNKKLCFLFRSDKNSGCYGNL